VDHKQPRRARIAFHSLSANTHLKDVRIMLARIALTSLSACFIFLTVALLPQMATATLIQVDIDTTIERLTTGGPTGAPALDPHYTAGDAVRVRFVYDTLGAQTSNLPGVRSTYDALQSFSIMINGDTFSAQSPGTSFTVSNDRSYGNPVVDDIQSTSTVVTGPGAGGMLPTFMVYAIDTSVLTTFASTAIPDLVSLNSLIDNRRAAGGFITFTGDGQPAQQIRFAPFSSTITATIVPEPGTALLMFLGLAGLSRTCRERSVSEPRFAPTDRT
jgi:hypothetical protein